MQARLSLQLFQFIRLGEVADVGRLLLAGADVNFPSPRGVTPLLAAVSHDFTNIAILLLEAGADVNATMAGRQREDPIAGFTPLHAAILHERMHMVSLLLEAGADKDKAASSYGHATPLILAVRLGEGGIVRLLLEAEADMEKADDDGNAPLSWAAYNGNIDVVRMMLTAGADQNTADEKGRTPLYRAAQRGHADTVTALLEAGADPDKADVSGVTPLHRAVQEGHTEAFWALQRGGADVNKEGVDGYTPLMTAVKRNDARFVRLLVVAAGADKEKADALGSTPLHAAAGNNFVDVALMLLEVGAEEDRTNAYGKSPLHEAALNGHIDVVQLLLESGADKNKTSIYGMTALDYAKQKGHTEVVALLEAPPPAVLQQRALIARLYNAAKEGNNAKVLSLVQRGVDVNRTDNEQQGQTALHAAASNGHTAVVITLIQAGANKDEPVTSSGWTALHKSASQGHADTVRVLVEARANKDAATNAGSTPLHLAAQWGHTGAVGVLLEAGADADKADNDGKTPHDVAAEEGRRGISALLHAPPPPTAGALLALVDARAARSSVTPSSHATIPVGEALREYDGKFASMEQSVRSASEFLERVAVLNQRIQTCAVVDDVLQAADERDSARRALYEALPQLLQQLAGDHLASQRLDCIELLQRLPPVDNVATSGGSDVGAALRRYDDWRCNVADADSAATMVSEATEGAASSLRATPVDAIAQVRAQAAWQLIQAAQTEAAMVNTQLQERAAVEATLQQAVAAARGDLHDELRRLDEAAALGERLHTFKVQWEQFGLQQRPDGKLARSAAKAARKARRKVNALLVAAADESSDDDDDDAEQHTQAQQFLRAARRAATEAAHTAEMERLELARACADFPELRVLHADLLDDLFATNGAARVDRSRADYEDVRGFGDSRNDVRLVNYQGRHCVLKAFRMGAADGASTFQREVRRLRRLAHPHIAEIEASFVEQEGAHGTVYGYLQMPYYEGGDSLAWARGGKRTDADVQRVFRGALLGLAHVHAEGIVHCDVKPRNIFVTADGVGKLGDFDVSKDDATRIGGTGTMATHVGGTQLYWAPDERATPKSDVYSFALSLFDVHFLAAAASCPSGRRC